MSNFKQYKFKSDKPYEIILVVEVFKKLGYTVQNGNLDILQAIKHGGICTWDDSEITEGYLEYNTHEDITLEGLKVIMCEESSPSVGVNANNTTTLRDQYKHLIGVQFNKNIYSFRECSPRYVHAIGRDMDRDVCVIDQYEIYYKLRDVEFYVSDDSDKTLPYLEYTQYVVLLNIFSFNKGEINGNN